MSSLNRAQNPMPVAWLIAFMLVTCVLIALAPLDSPAPGEHLVIGFLLGSLLGHTFLASIWTVLGPGSAKLRLPLACVWGAAISMAILANSLLYAAPTGLGMIYMSQIGIASLAQVIGWLVRWRFGVRVGRQPVAAVAQVDGSVVTNQYGIQHLMIVTTVIAITIALGRALLGSILPLLQDGEFSIFAFLVVAACLICVPVLFSLLSMRRAWLSLLVLVCFLGLVTYLELPLLRTFTRTRGPDWLHILLINLFTLLPVVVIAGALRYLGYRLISRQQRLHQDKLAEESLLERGLASGKELSASPE